MKKLLSAILALAMLLSFGAISAFAEWEAPCACAECVEETCECTEEVCTCECCAEEEEEPEDEDPPTGFQGWKIRLEKGDFGDMFKALAKWNDWILKIIYYVLFGWLSNIIIEITIIPKW